MSAPMDRMYAASQFTGGRRIMTFGIELEVVVIMRKTQLIAINKARGIPENETIDHRNEYMREMITHSLSTNDKDPYNPADLPMPPYTWDNMSLGRVLLTEPKQADYRYWSVCKEASVGCFTSDILKGFGWRKRPDKTDEFDAEFWYDGAEIVSSILCMEAQFQWERQLEKITKLLHITTSDGDWPHPHAPLLCRTPRAANCGLHVHIGYGTEDIPWRVVQTIYILWGIYEEEIESLQPIERRASHNDYATSLRAQCHPFTYKRFATGIMSTQNPQQLLNLLASQPDKARDLKIGISPARGDGISPGSKRQTLEFREGNGSIIYTNIKWWIKFIEAIVRLAQSIVDINFDLVGDLYDMHAGRPGLFLCESIFDHISIVNLNQEGRDFFAEQATYFATLASPSQDSESSGTTFFESME